MPRTTRRDFMERAGVIGSAGTLTALAGCTGGIGGGDDGGGSVRVATAPTPTTQLEVEFIREETDILEGVFDEIGYEVDLQLTWDELSQFLGGNADIAPSVGTVEAAQLATERDMNLTAHARSTPQHTGLYVREGSDYDPDEAGGKQAAVDQLVDDGGKFGIGGWGLGTIPAYRIIFQEKYGYEFTEDGDFDVVTGDLPSLATMLDEGNIDAGTSGPPYGLLPVRDEVKPLLWNQEELPDVNLPKLTMCISNGITRQSYAEEDTDAVAAWYGVAKYAAEHMARNVEEVAARDSTQEVLNVPNAEAAEWVLGFRYRAEHTANEHPASLQDLGLTDDRIEQDREAIGRIEEMGLVPGGWEESVDYMKHDLDRYYELAGEHE